MASAVMSAVTKQDAERVLEDKALQEEELWDELENEELPAYIREKRFSELKAQMHTLQEMQASRHGVYEELEKEKDFLSATTSEQYVVCHFYLKDYKRCKIVDRHLELLAEKHFKTKFMKINAEICPFFVTKLQVRVLPTIVCFKKGIVCDRVVGFEDLGNRDDFTTKEFEKRLGRSGIFGTTTAPKDNKPSSSIFGFGARDQSDDDE
eukprot:Colp12_sorted_trinity150504_noHs@19788